MKDWMTMKPYLVVDVDGVLNRMVSNSVGRSRGLVRQRIHPTNHMFSYTLHLDPGDGQRLLDITDVFDLAWGTTWEDDANRFISPVVGLPGDLPVAHTQMSESSKVPGVMRLADGRDFVWLDDALSEHDHELLESYPGNTHVVTIDPVAGLTMENLATARQVADSWTAHVAP